MPDDCPLPNAQDAFIAGMNHALRMATKCVPNETFRKAWNEFKESIENTA